ncbi:MAG: hypothetical protein JSR77_18485 [Planctomycetes bacterium]|nr:hypothetical protein [Planctomycetota bacterium]
MPVPTRTQITASIQTICDTNEEIRSFWEKSHGWAPKAAAELLAKSRLDRQVALSHTLSLWISKRKGPDHDARLILAWTNLGSLMEGSFKTFLSVFLEDYRKSSNPMRKRGRMIDPDAATLEGLRTFLNADVWVPDEIQRWDAWSARVQQRRNAVHAYRDRDIGSFAEFHSDLITYAEFIVEMKLRLPYPD